MMSFKAGDTVRHIREPVVGTVQEVLLGVPTDSYMVKWTGFSAVYRHPEAALIKVEDNDDGR